MIVVVLLWDGRRECRLSDLRAEFFPYYLMKPLNWVDLGQVY
ncbi:hypothetical protein Oscil6304_5947 [Oscillatoria acuminata PCC 6304]|uniref:Uncharacterized protein n=1 Tax=Oscillatoria acuminata PCC 6304 TaxID=56110 RepID=K9TS84_9CYAN|nr:hypothetical protein Oscil6304_5947 [Oscillatoria acuminata PCC 6304]